MSQRHSPSPHLYTLATHLTTAKGAGRPFLSRLRETGGAQQSSESGRAAGTTFSDRLRASLDRRDADGRHGEHPTTVVLGARHIFSNQSDDCSGSLSVQIFTASPP